MEGDRHSTMWITAPEHSGPSTHPQTDRHESENGGHKFESPLSSRVEFQKELD